MPWMETCPVEQRVRFVMDVREEGWPVAAAARAYGISRKTAHKWLERHKAGGLDALRDRPRARRRQAHATPPEIRELVIQARRRFPTWGPKKLRPWLSRRYPLAELPSLTTMATILREAGLVRPRRQRRRLVGAQGPRGAEDRPNGVWAVDFKGDFRLGDGSRCYPLTVTDACSRYLLACRGLEGTSCHPVRAAFSRLFDDFGLPERIRSDNGVPFASRAAGRLSRLSVWWIDLGIELHRITPGRPQENGRHERMHSTLKRQTASPPASTRRAQQRRFDRFCEHFNCERPHEALAQTCPAEHYAPSSRPRPHRLEPAEYPGHYEVRGVRSDGSIRWRGELVYVSECIRGRRVGMVEVEEGRWQIYYRHHPLGTLSDGASPRIRPLAPPGPQART